MIRHLLICRPLRRKQKIVFYLSWPFEVCSGCGRKRALWRPGKNYRLVATSMGYHHASRQDDQG